MIKSLNTKYPILFLLLFAFASSSAQTIFKRVDSIKIETLTNGVFYKNAWAGGLNSMQFSEIDLDGDGKKDLFAFDRTGDKIKTFLNKGTPGTTNYVHAPQYEDKFPPIDSWVLLRDYNCDGKNDIFTYYPGGVSLYKNISTPGNLAFVQITKLIQHYNPTVTIPYSQIYCTSVDQPAIDDIDNDGDLDIITFGQFGSFVEYYRNYSMETYGICDSINKYEIKNKCWGWFYEGGTNFNMTLNIPKNTCWNNVPNPERTSNGGNKDLKHAGSTLLTLDVNGDSVKELVVGDVSYNYMTILHNGGKTDSAHMTSDDTLFPKNQGNSLPLGLDIFPGAYYLDINNDDKKDLLFSPFYVTQIAGKTYIQNYKSVWNYTNSGSNNLPSFTFQSKDFLQSDMIDLGEGAYPVFFDYNGDGKKDLVISNFGYYDSTGYYKSQLALYENTGTAINPKFKLVTKDYQGLSTHILNLDSMTRTQAIYPTFGDVDGDGDKDMIVGELTGQLHLYTNTPSLGVASFSLTKTFVDSIDVGDFSTPQLIDLDRDGKIDLVVGDMWGRLRYYRNIGTTSVPKWSKVTDTLGGVNMSKPPYFYLGYSVPHIFDNGGNYEMLVGSSSGDVHHYDNIDGNLAGNFNLKTINKMGFYEGIRTAPAVYDIDSNTLWDFVVGNYAGGINLYMQDMLTTSDLIDAANTKFDIVVYPNPATNKVNVILNQKIISSYTITVYDINGKTLYQSQNQYGNVEIDVSSFPKGMYIINVNSPQTSFSKHEKFIKQ